jgi:hypothetical protein
MALSGASAGSTCPSTIVPSCCLQVILLDAEHELAIERHGLEDHVKPLVVLVNEATLMMSQKAVSFSRSSMMCAG